MPEDHLVYENEAHAGPGCSETPRCPECGFELELDEEECPNCGAILGDYEKFGDILR